MDSKAKEKLDKSRSVILEAVVLGLTLSFVGALQRVLTKYASDWNMWGLDTDIFLMLAFGVMLVLLVWLGVVNKPHI